MVQALSTPPLSEAPSSVRAGHPGFGVIIPARYASARLPGKPLRSIAGVPMIVRVYENACRTGAQFVLVATDDERIARAVEQAGGQALLTSPHHASGTDRLAEVAALRKLDPDSIVVNVQGDEPLFDTEHVRRVASTLAADPRAGMATLATPIRDERSFSDPNVVKVVTARDGRALYFSRAPIPWDRSRSGSMDGCFRHVGLYAYRVKTLLRLAAEPPTELERIEMLEQLRALWLGIAIQVEVVDQVPGHGVDTEEDLLRVEAFFGATGGGP